MTRLICPSVYKVSERDDYKNGCIGEITDHSYDHTIQGDTLHEIKTAICNHLNCEMVDLSVDYSDQPNVINAQFHELKTGEKATKNQIKKWKKGDLQLWLVDYVFEFYAPVNLKDYE